MMKYQLTPVPFCFGTAEGLLTKTNKAASIHHLTKDMGDELQTLAATSLIIVDGNALFHGMTEIPETFRGVSEKLFSMLPSTSDVVFSTDSYSDISIKSIERT